jgi:hypothetical protein
MVEPSGNENQRLPSDVSNILRNLSFFREVSDLERILKPIADSISRLERRDTTLADCLVEFLRICDDVQRAAERGLGRAIDTEADFVEHIVRVLNFRFSEYHNSLYLVGLYLHPGYKQLSVSKNKSWNDVLDAVFRIARDNFDYDDDEFRLLAQQLRWYHQDRPPFTSKRYNADPVAYWKDLSNENACKVKEFALKLFEVVPSAVETERLFSNLSDTKWKKRNKMAPNRLRAQAQMQGFYKASDPQTGAWKSFQPRKNTLGGVDGANTVSQALESQPDGSHSVSDNTIADVSFEDIDDEELPEFETVADYSSNQSGEGTTDGGNGATAQTLSLDDLDTYLEDSFLHLNQQLRSKGTSSHSLLAREEYDLNYLRRSNENEVSDDEAMGGSDTAPSTSTRSYNLTLDSVLQEWGDATDA